MAEQDNTFLTANDIYEDVEGVTRESLIDVEAEISGEMLGLASIIETSTVQAEIDIAREEIKKLQSEKINAVCSTRN